MKYLFVFCFAFAASALGKDLPSYIPICKRTDPELNECIRKATVVVQPYLAKGIKELHIPLFEPLTLPMIMLEQGTNAVNFKAKISNIKIFGLSNYKFKSVRADFIKEKNLVAEVELPKIDLVADYEIKGNVLVLPIQGNGEMTANLTNCQADVTVNSDVIKKNGDDYLHSKEVKIRLHFGDTKAHFDNLFNGDSVLGMTTNNFLNENVNDVLNEIKPALEAVTSMLIEDLMNKVFRTTPFDKLFPK